MRQALAIMALLLLAVPVDRAQAGEPVPGQEHRWGYECAAWLAGVEPVGVIIPRWSDGLIPLCGGVRLALGCFNDNSRAMTLRRLFGSRLLQIAVHEGHHAVEADQKWPHSERDAWSAARHYGDCINFKPD